LKDHNYSDHDKCLQSSETERRPCSSRYCCFLPSLSLFPCFLFLSASSFASFIFSSMSSLSYFLSCFLHRLIFFSFSACVNRTNHAMLTALVHLMSTSCPLRRTVLCVPPRRVLSHGKMLLQRNNFAFCSSFLQDCSTFRVKLNCGLLLTHCRRVTKSRAPRSDGLVILILLGSSNTWVAVSNPARFTWEHLTL
jgi:hypothetical protein